MWLLCVVIGIVLFWESSDLVAVGEAVLMDVAGLGRRASSRPNVLRFSATEWIRTAVGLAGYAQGMASTMPWPVCVRVFAVVTAGVVEETLFHGYALTRVAALSGRVAFAALASTAVSASQHFPPDPSDCAAPGHPIGAIL